METPDNEAGRLTEQMMHELWEAVPGKHPSTERYNAAYSAVYALLSELLDIESGEVKRG